MKTSAGPSGLFKVPFLIPFILILKAPHHPFRSVIEKQLKEAHAKDQKAIVSALEEKKRLLLAPAFISQKK